MTRIIAGLAIAALLLAGLQTWRLSGWQARATAAEAQVSSLQAGIAAAAALQAELAALREDAARLDHDLSTMEGADAPLSDFLRAGAGRVWP